MGGVFRNESGSMCGWYRASGTQSEVPVKDRSATGGSEGDRMVLNDVSEGSLEGENIYG